MEKKSDREIVQKKLVEWLLEHLSKFNAPYGILDGIEPFAKGKVRTVTFGIARYLDAVIRIYRPNNISIDGKGALAMKYAGNYKSLEEVIKALEK